MSHWMPQDEAQLYLGHPVFFISIGIHPNQWYNETYCVKHQRYS